MKRAVLLLLVAGWAFAQPELVTETRNGVVRAVVRHATNNEPVTEANPALPGEALVAEAASMAEDTRVFVGTQQVDATMLEGGYVAFQVPADAKGAFVSLTLTDERGRSPEASFPVNGIEDGIQLGVADVRELITTAAMALDNATLAVAVVDRAGRPLGLLRRPGATDDIAETALSLARTGAFFSHNEAPLSSRTVRFISTENFPEGIPNQPAAALFGIELTNRGCLLSNDYLPGKEIPRSRDRNGTGTSRGITTVPGGVPIFRNGTINVGGIGVAGVDPNAAEFAAVVAVIGKFFRALPLPPPGAVFIDGFRLPFVNQTTRPAGTNAASALNGTFAIEPVSGNPVPDGWLIGPKAGSRLSIAEVRQVIETAVARAERTRAQIRLPLGTRAKFMFAVADVDGTILGMFRQPDATIFSIDVAATKARNVIYFSSATRRQDDLPGVPPGIAVTNRTIGFGAQSFFPSGIFNSMRGPFRDLFEYDRANPCTQGRGGAGPNSSGIVFFPGASALYKGDQIVGGFGVSGDGVEQDDYVTAGGIVGFEAPVDKRADTVFIDTPLGKVRLPYLKFPRNPEQ